MQQPPNPNGENTSPTTTPDPDDAAETLYTADEVERIVQQRLGRETQRRTPARQPPTPPSADLAPMIQSMVQLQLAQMLGAMNGGQGAPQNVQPASDRGSPPPSRVPIEEMDIVRMSDSDRRALIQAKGARWYTDKLRAQLKGRPVKMR